MINALSHHDNDSSTVVTEVFPRTIEVAQTIQIEEIMTTTFRQDAAKGLKHPGVDRRQNISMKARSLVFFILGLPALRKRHRRRRRRLQHGAGCLTQFAR